jgi:alkylation response protein AidB-like acyl-CoA dehydrogenase
VTELGDMLRRRLAGTAPEAAWAELTEAGVPGLLIPEALGGLGLSVADAAPVLDALGELGLSTPFLETAILAPLLLQGHAGDVLRDIAGGATVAIAGLERSLRGGVSATPTPTSASTTTGWRLDGEAKLVPDGGSAPHILVAARTEGGGTALLLVANGQPGLSARTYPTIDDRQAADLLFVGAEATLLLADAREAMEAAEDTAITCIAIEAAALMRQLVARTHAHLRDRQQFGQPIGKFQVLQHRLVDMQIESRRAAAIATRALEALPGHWRDRGRLASAAKVTIAEAARFVGQNAVQLHGAMGMTRELDIGRYFRRLTVIEGQLGTAAQHRARFARLAA